jgi:hypothetical protein
MDDLYYNSIQNKSEQIRTHESNSNSIQWNTFIYLYKLDFKRM